MKNFITPTVEFKVIIIKNDGCTIAFDLKGKASDDMASRLQKEAGRYLTSTFHKCSSNDFVVVTELQDGGVTDSKGTMRPWHTSIRMTYTLGELAVG